MRKRNTTTSPHPACQRGQRRRVACRCPLCRHLAVPLAVGALAYLPSASAHAHEMLPGQLVPSTHTGIVRDAQGGNPLTGARVLVIGTNLAATTSGDGVFRFDVALPDSFSVHVERLGYRSKTVEARVGADGWIEIELDPSPLALQPLVVTGAVTARPATETARPVTVLGGEELQIRLRGTVAGALAHEPGFATGTMGPATAQPVIRGLGGDRVEHERPSWFARVEAELAQGQERLGEFETPTAGYEKFDVVAGLRFNVAGRLSVLTASLENVTNEEYRNHLSRAKEVLPEAERGLAVSWRVAF